MKIPPLTSMLCRSLSPHKRFLLHVRRTDFRSYQRTIRRTALCFSFGFLFPCPQGIRQRRCPNFQQVFLFLCSVSNLTFQVFVDIHLALAFLLDQFQEQVCVLSDLLDDHLVCNLSARLYRSLFPSTHFTHTALAHLMPSIWKCASISVSKPTLLPPFFLFVLSLYILQSSVFENCFRCCCVPHIVCVIVR